MPVSSTDYIKEKKKRNEEAHKIIEQLNQSGWKGELSLHFDGAGIAKIKKSEYI